MARAPLLQTDPSQVGRYRLVARLGAGGMGVVYLGASQDGQQVAVKVLRPELADNPEFRARFGREVTMLTRVQGVCTVRVIQADTKGPKPFLVTEFADGPSLSEYINARGPLDARMLYGLATGLAEALTAIHAAGIVHRDLKPSNVLLTAGGPKVIDFGIAQALDTTSLTRTGITLGSAGFMAPEQIMGKAWTPADIFTWGVTVAYAASGQAPFGTGPPDAIMYRIVHAAPDISAVPPRLRPLVEAALAKEPRDRPTAPQLLSELTHTAAQPSVGSGNPTQTILAQTWHPSEPGPAGPPTGSAPPGRPRSSRRGKILLPVVLSLAFVLAAAGTAVGLALAGGSAGLARAWGRQHDADPPGADHPGQHDQSHDGTAHLPGRGRHESGHHQPGYHEPGHHQAGHQQPGHYQANHQQPSYYQPGYHQPRYHQPGHHEPGHHGRIAASGPYDRSVPALGQGVITIRPTVSPSASRCRTLGTSSSPSRSLTSGRIAPSATSLVSCRWHSPMSSGILAWYRPQCRPTIE